MELELWKKESIAFFLSITYLSLIFSFNQNYVFSFDLLLTSFLFSLLALGSKILIQRHICSRLNLKGVLKLWYPGIILGAFLAVFGIKLSLPSILDIKPFKFGRWGFKTSHMTHKEGALISLAGLLPLFLLLLIFKYIIKNHFLFSLSSWIFFSNLLPLPKSDGSNILMWRFSAWVFILLAGVLTLIF
ncbi:MAG: hypothetical protein J7L39_04185 [Candidatus Aenigmarchaeota archaeon]|nr:hypothetical protein [Candidatus Aenigmarchaeota archaeon]